ncbi:hypothetical protein WICMUC_005739 [Wickerhamomyces mucosus]|uniref:Nodulin-like domain-containing protein n=1 Tax=Wickerhamomyces mucosus TaxID=1378264 RepID=A0A9P8T3M8_9ASCO|nr:hypothetical protein WICMUC_005739 [Wickerhamomyces mucosus]
MSSAYHRAATLLSCTLVGFVCGTLYLYSAFGPQLAHRLSYSGTDAQFIAFSGTIGIALSGVPAGLIIDQRGFTIALIIGALSIALGYLGLKDQFDDVYESVSLSAFFVFLVGAGSTFINSSLIKCCAISFPNNRGIATSFPIATYGLSAFAYSAVGSLLFKTDTSRFLGFLGYSSLAICLIGLPSIYLADANSNKGQTIRNLPRPSLESRSSSGKRSPSIELQPYPLGSGSFPRQKNLAEELIQKKIQASSDSSPVEILKSTNFWLVLIVLGALAALGQMYIYSVGYIVKSLLSEVGDDKVITKEQQFQVSVLSIANCAGRLLCGILGDLISNSLKKSRSWILFFPCSLLLLVQIVGYQLEDYSKLWIESIINGIGYGFTWSSIPQLLIEYFGVGSFSFAWGVINLGPIIPAYYFTHLFGSIYDSNLTIDETTKLENCLVKSDCYRSTFGRTFFFALITFVVVFWINVSPIWRNRRSPRDTFIN